MLRLLAALLSLALLPALALAQSSAKKDRTIWESNGFLAAHPDVKHRKLGLHWMELGRDDRAMEEFVRAARYADKPSQAMLAEMHWNGEGAAQDRARAYAWMDLAAERGYTLFVGKREAYWADLDASERERALAIGGELYAEFGDSIARERIAKVLDRSSRRATGSRIGAVGFVKILLFDEAITTQVDGSQYYASHFWTPERYFEWTDEIWQPMPLPSVEVGNPARRDAAGGRGEI